MREWPISFPMLIWLVCLLLHAVLSLSHLQITLTLCLILNFRTIEHLVLQNIFACMGGQLFSISSYAFSIYCFCYGLACWNIDAWLITLRLSPLFCHCTIDSILVYYLDMTVITHDVSFISAILPVD